MAGLKFRLAAWAIAALCIPSTMADMPLRVTQLDGTWSHTVYVGNMTSNKWEELFFSADFIDSYLAGYALTFDHSISPRWSIGAEAQLTYHFGDQTYAEIGMPLTLRYRPENPWLRVLDSFAFGLGMSHTTEVPQVEIDNGDGERSRRNLFYWMLETQFESGRPGRRWFLRIHHRSDAWGTLEPEGGSNALAFGLRQDF